MATSSSSNPEFRLDPVILCDVLDFAETIHDLRQEIDGVIAILNDLDDLDVGVEAALRAELRAMAYEAWARMTPLRRFCPACGPWAMSGSDGWIMERARQRPEPPNAPLVFRAALH